MQIILSLLFLLFLCSLVIGIIKPNKVNMKSRGEVFKSFGGILLVLLVIICAVADPVEKNEVSSVDEKVVDTQYLEKTLEDWSNISKSEREKWISYFMADKSLPEKEKELFYRCMSQNSMTKLNTLRVGEVLGWCKADYEQDPTRLSKMLNFDNFETQFSPWDGSHRKLEKFIKSLMNDEASYDHIKTTYRLVLNENPRAIVTTTFKGRNVFGGMIKQSITAAVDIETGDILEIIE